MEFEIIKDIKNPLFDRREIEGKIKAEIIPSRKEVTDKVSEKFSVNSENIKIKSIKGKFGSKSFSVKLNIYSSKEEKDKIERKKKKEIEEEKRILEAEKAQNIASEKESEEKSPETENKEEISKENKD